MAIAGWALIVWTRRSWPGLYVGHGWRTDQQLVTRGAYGLVRHPVYLAAIVIWVAMALGFLSSVVGLVTVGYVIPAYLLYARSEEQMLEDQLGKEYRRYMATVPMITPRFKRGMLRQKS